MRLGKPILLHQPTRVPNLKLAFVKRCRLNRYVTVSYAPDRVPASHKMLIDRITDVALERMQEMP